MNRKYSVLSAALAANAVSAHICMWNPLQRGGNFELTIPGQSICYLKQGPCGNKEPGEPLTALTGGQRFDVRFQQNLNHFYQENPGRLQADFAEVPNPTEEDFYPLGQIADWNGYNMITQTNFTLNVDVPNIDCEHCVLRMRYISQNPTEDHGGSPSFHQCADVSVRKSDSSSVVTPPASKSDASGAGNQCCAPKQFTLEGYETGSGWRNPTSMKFYFDAVNELFRIDTNSGDGTTSKDGKFSMFNDFKNGIEYYYNVNTGVCDLYGLNLWADWCYGDVNKQVYSSTVRVGDDYADVWSMEGNDFFFSNTQETCTPVSKFRSSSGESTMYFNMKEGAPQKDFFDLPAACLEAAKGVDIKSLSRTPVQHKHL